MSFTAFEWFTMNSVEPERMFACMATTFINYGLHLDTEFTRRIHDLTATLAGRVRADTTI